MNINKKGIGCFLVCFTLFFTVCSPQTNISAQPEDDVYYALAIPVFENQSYYQQIEIVNTINRCLSNNVSVYWVADSFECSVDSFDGKFHGVENLPKGSFIIDASSSPESLGCYASNLSFLSFFLSVPVYFVSEQLSDISVMKLRFPRIVFHDGSNVASHSYEYLLQSSGFSHSKKLGWNEIASNLSFDDFDVFVWGGHFGNGLDIVLGQFKRDSLNAIRSFVRQGGGYIGSCYGSYEITTSLPIPFREMLIRFPKIPSSFFLSFSTRFPFKAIPGYCDINVTLTDVSSPLSFGLPNKITNCYYAEGPVFLGRQGNTQDVAVIDSIDFSWFWSSMHLDDYPFFSNLRDKRMNFSVGKPIWVTTEFGDGRVIAFGDHPEHHDKYPRIVHNAVFYATASEPASVSLDDGLLLFNLSECFNGSCFRGYENVPVQFECKNSSNISDVVWRMNDFVVFEAESCLYAFSFGGNYSVFVTAVDKDMRLGVAPVPVVIAKEVAGSFVLNHSVVYVNESVLFSLDVAGGFPPYRYYWQVEEKEVSLNQSFSYVFFEEGDSFVEVVVKDQTGSEFSFGEYVWVESRNQTENQQQLDDEIQSSSDSFYFFVSLVLGSLLMTVACAFFIYWRKSSE